MEIVTVDIEEMAPQKKPLSMKEKQELWYKFYPNITSELYLQMLWTSRKARPYLECSTGKDTYCTADKERGHQKIVIGLDAFQCYDETEFLIWVLYLLDHEVGHVKHTPSKPWRNGIIRGYHAVVEEISKLVEPTPRAFRKEEDYDRFLNWLETDKGVTIQPDAIKHFCHGIQNSLEDGREERLQSKDSYAFKMRKRYCRGVFWNEGEMPDSMIASSTDPETRFLIKLNQVLSLATTLLYQKGFDKIPDESIYNEVEDTLVPLINKAYYSRSCSGCMDMAVEIERILAREMFEAIKSHNSALDELMKKLIIQPAEDEEHNGLTNTEISDEEGDEGSGAGSGSGIFGDEDDTASGTGVDGDGNGEDGEGDSKGKSSKSKEINGFRPINDADDGKDGEESAGCIYDHTNNRSGSRNESTGAAEVSDFDAVSKAIQEAMLDAKNQAAGLLESVVAASKKPQPKEKSIIHEKIEPSKAVKSAYAENVKFEDNKRVYELRYKLPGELEGRASKFANEIAEILQNQRKTLNGLNSGSLNSNAIYKLLIGDTDMFYRYDEPKKFDGAVYFLQDNSGSMGYGAGSKREYASEAVAVVEKGFSQLMPMKHVAFDAMGSNFVAHETIKEFDEVQDLSCAYNFLMQGRGGCGNKDGYSIRIATQELLNRPEEEKLLVILSDGAPSDYRGGFAAGRADVKDAVDSARNQGVTVVPIYFADNIENNREIDNYKEMYGEKIIATTPDRIETELCSLLKTFCFG